MRLPNSYGGVCFLKGNRRKPYLARVTQGWEYKNGKKRQVYLTIGYYATREEALNALAEYHKIPYDSIRNLTFFQVYERWSAEKYPKLSQSAIRNHETSFRICQPICKMKFADLRLAHFQGVIDGCGKNYPVLEKVKSMLIQMSEFAIKNDICVKNYAEFVDINKHKEDHEELHKIFTTEEVIKLWELAPQSLDIRQILMLICSGLRISEMLYLKKEDVFMDDRYFIVRESKTESGVRVVPIPSAVLPFWQELMEIHGTYVIPNPRFPDDPLSYKAYLDNHYKKPLKQYGFDKHTPHDTRYTFISILTAAKVLPVVIKRIVGHKSSDVTERVYTHFEIRQLVSTVDAPDFKQPYMEETLTL